MNEIRPLQEEKMPLYNDKNQVLIVSASKISLHVQIKAHQDVNVPRQ
uniref:Uncharacterized protein n=1 Tax=Picea glauca TaxID=3330 RepID=A0A124GMX3_PICGL|nr:hypothetical protein ABT39_MTgene6037 [Picea glauca]